LQNTLPMYGVLHITNDDKTWVKQKGPVQKHRALLDVIIKSLIIYRLQ
jgi:hypothetical protein